MMAKSKKKKDDELIKLSRESKIQSSIDKNGNVLHLGKNGYLKETGALDNKTLKEIQQADFIQKYPKCCVLPKFTKFHIHLIFPCCPPYIPPLPTARISWMGPFPDRLDAPSWADRMYLPGPT